MSTGTLRYQLSGNVSFGSYVDSFSPTPTTITLNTAGASAGILTAATGSGTTLPTVSVSTNGYLFLLNTDSTNYVTFNGFGKLKPGEPAMLRLQTGITVTLTANTAPVQVQYLLLND